jgi:hypothetical protein
LHGGHSFPSKGFHRGPVECSRILPGFFMFKSYDA